MRRGYRERGAVGKLNPVSGSNVEVVSESRGSEIVRGRFAAAGIELVENYAMALANRVVHLDGYDPSRRVGFEYVTTEAGDREEWTPDVIDALEACAMRGELYVLLLDETQALGEAGLARAADRFLASALDKLGGSPEAAST